MTDITVLSVLMDRNTFFYADKRKVESRLVPPGRVLDGNIPVEAMMEEEVVKRLLKAEGGDQHLRSYKDSLGSAAHRDYVLYNVSYGTPLRDIFTAETSISGDSASDRIEYQILKTWLEIHNALPPGGLHKMASIADSIRSIPIHQDGDITTDWFLSAEDILNAGGTPMLSNWVKRVTEEYKIHNSSFPDKRFICLTLDLPIHHGDVEGLNMNITDLRHKGDVSDMSREEITEIVKEIKSLIEDITKD